MDEALVDGTKLYNPSPMKSSDSTPTEWLTYDICLVPPSSQRDNRVQNPIRSPAPPKTPQNGSSPIFFSDLDAISMRKG